MKYIDPSGLILFAFDGTGNGRKPEAGSSLTNVVKFLRAYNEIINGGAFYITGIGTTDLNMPAKGNIAFGTGFDERVALGFKFLDDHINRSTGTEALDIDVVGFSRGAAEARRWLNLLAEKMPDGRYTANGKSRCLNLRFAGLFDTVSHLVDLDGRDKNYNFTIPSAVRYAAHAVAINEHRGGGIHFDLRSILDPTQKSGGTRIEQGFIGAHSDIGGGYASGDLSDVALMWMVQQAKQQGIKFRDDIINASGWDVVTLPILHDSSRNGYPGPHTHPASAPRDDNRSVIYSDGTMIQATLEVQIGGHSVAETKPLISYYRSSCGVYGSPAVGLIDLSKYSEWTSKLGINIGFQQPAASNANICE